MDAPYNAANSAGSNLGPTTQKLADRVKADVESLRKARPAAAIPVERSPPPAAASTPTSRRTTALLAGAARRQGARPAGGSASRAWSTAQTEGRTLGFLGEPRVNVLRLNLALDALEP